MIFRNATMFRLTTNAASAVESALLETRLEEHKLNPVGGLAIESIGWVSPFGPTDRTLSVRSGSFVGLTLGSETRVLPPGVINKALSDRIAKLETERGKRVGGRERKRLRDEILTDLIPRAFVQPGRVNCYLDLSEGWLVVDSSSRTAAERVLSCLRATFEHLPAMPPEPAESIRSLVTGWLAGAPRPDGFELGDSALLRDPSDRAAQARLKGMDLATDEVAEHLRSGKQCTELALAVDQAVALRVDEAFTVRGIRILDVDQAMGPAEHDSPRAEIDARFALFTLVFARTLQRLAETFRWDRPVDRGARPL